jgi:hypothetical protein
MGSGADARMTLLARSILGLAAGLLLAVGLSLVPLLALAVFVGAMLYGPVAIWRHDAAQAAFVGGLLVGAALVLAYGWVSTYGACRTTTDFCGNANLLPLATVTVLGLAEGVAVSLVARRHQRPVR